MMHPSPDRTLTADEAARIVYNTSHPTPEQVGQVRLRIIQGHIPPRPGSQSTTTAQAVAAYLARAAVARQGAARPATELSGFYRDLFQDYFLAVVARRKIGQRSDSFQRAVLMGQVALMALLAATVCGVAYLAIHPEPPERAAVRQWVKQQYGSVVFHEWSPTFSADEAGGPCVRVQFTYRTPSHHYVRTDRTFLVQGGEVRPLGSAED